MVTDDSSWTILWNYNQAPDWAHPHLASRIGDDRCSSGFTPFTLTILKSDSRLVGIVSVWRSLAVVFSSVERLLPSSAAPVYHLGLYREKVTLQPVEYYSKLPPSPPVDQVYLLDPLLATGGTVCAALTMINDWGIPVKNIKLLCVLASEEGLQRVQSEYPDLEVKNFPPVLLALYLIWRDSFGLLQ
ncbi:hypothetical protein H1R20_g6878, partial [Candolleomyces eurysporus]